ncbi:hypothetical protein [Jiangella alba]|uniref:Uncharacterized protein n=1 Tax=Jiangella alba TaxID=561176 RepID=A0A1H5LW50_9ACTN|nr:hypothetical protein [Jiangella alba]SEE81256.1 hypothetical protein SAMN04488561_2802 [Jiangella alba]
MGISDAPPPPPPRPLARLRHWHRTLGTGNRLALYALVLTAGGLAVPLVAAGWTAFTGPSVGVLVDQSDSACESVWTVPPGNEELAEEVNANTDARQLTRWARDGRLVHRNDLHAAVSLRSRESPIEIRDLSITVLSRTDPATGGAVGPGGCGGGEIDDEPDFVVVDLDTLPVGAEVPVSYLQTSAQQAEARALADELGEQITLPRTLPAQDYYSFTLVGRTVAYDTEWQATITWWDGEKIHTDVLDDDGRPFRVTAPD